MSPRCVPGAAAVVLLAPCDGMIKAHRASRIRRLVQSGQHMDGAARIGLEVIPFVRPHPAFRQRDGGGINLISHLDRGRGGAGWMTEKPGADQSAVPRPGVFRVRRGMNSNKAAAGLDVTLKGRLL